MLSRVQDFLRGQAVLALLMGALFLGVGYRTRMQVVDANLPYCSHIDEGVWTRQAIRILKTGDLNPHRFTKPSVMVYLDTGAFALGLLRAGMRGEDLPEPAQLTEGGYPYYSSRTMIRTARQVYALASLATLALAALLARQLARVVLLKDPTRPIRESSEAVAPWVSVPDGVALLTLGLGLVSPLYFDHSVRYLGVDLLGCLVQMIALTFFLALGRPKSPTVFALVGGSLVGLCLGTKYNFYPMFVPFFAAVLFYYPRALVSSLLIGTLSALATFLATTPFALLDLPAFIWSAAGEALHYTVGHQPGGAAKAVHLREPGLATLWGYLRTIPNNFGWGVFLLTLVGALRLVQRAPREAAVLLSFPILLWLYMARQRAFFERNLLLFQVVAPMLAALGVFWVYGTLLTRLSARPLAPRRAGLGVVLALAAIGFATYPYRTAGRVWDTLEDSRGKLARWLQGRSEEAGQILVAVELEIDPRSLPRQLRVVPFDASETNLAELSAQHPGTLAIVPRFKASDKRWPVEPSQVLFSAGHRWVRTTPGGLWDVNTHVQQGDPKMLVLRP